MRTPPLILVVDDNELNVDILETRLLDQGYQVITAGDGEQGIQAARERQPDLILMDVMMPKIDGITACKTIKTDASLPFMPVIMVTARADSRDIVAGLEAGASDYLTKPVDHAALLARVRSMLRIKELHDTVQEQAAQLADWNRTLEQRVQEQLLELQQLGRLKRFFSPHLAEVIVSQGGEDLLNSHRREISVVFCDLRGFTAFSETAEPEDVMGVLQEYHATMGKVIFDFEGTIERFVGDSIMVFFNDPLPCPGHELRAVQMALAMREQAQALATGWRRRGHELGLGIGIAQGFATLGRIGFEGRFEYSATGPVANLASRLCNQAQNGQILISQRVYSAVERQIEVAALGELEFKGFHRPVAVYDVLELRS
jgi:class 3 adenylate cyclase/CheY-like chemotaxis protein